MSDDAAQGFGGCVERKTQYQTVSCNEFNLVGRHYRRRLDLNRQKRHRGNGRGLVMFVDPVFDGLRRAVKLPSNLGDGTVMNNDLFGGMTLNGKVIAGRFFTHGWLQKKGFLEKETTKSLSTQKGIL